MATNQPPPRPDRKTRRERQRATRHAGIFRPLAIVFFFVPIALWAIGVQSESTDNRALAPFPSSWTSWDVMDETAAYVNDHVPFRGTAIRLRADVSQSVFGEAPPGQGGLADEAPKSKPPTRADREFADLPTVATEPQITGSADVLVGTDGWLYLAGELIAECDVTEERRQAVIVGYQRLEQILAASGRELYITFAPDKSTAEPDHLPADNPFAECSGPAKQATFSSLRASGIDGYIDMRRIIERRRVAEARPYYYRKDTHWNGLAQAAFAETLIKRLDPTLLATTTVKESVKTYVGDLTQFLGTPTEDNVILTTFDRPGVGVEVNRYENLSLDGATLVLCTATSTSAPLYAGDAIMIGDSFAETLLEELSPFFPTLRWIHASTVPTAPATTIEKMAEAKVVILVNVERNLVDGVLWTDAFLDELEVQLAPYAP